MIADNLQIPTQKPTYQKHNIWNIGAILYIFCGYITGIILLFSTDTLANLLGVFFLTHGLVLSAYMTHEFIHNTIFDNKRANVIAGNIMLWINGSCYFSFLDLQKLHMAHHCDKVDLSSVELSDFIDKTPFKKIILALEWFHFPILGLLLRFRAIALPFFREEYREARTRILCFLAIRISLFTVLALHSVKALFLYTLSFIGMVIVLQFMDAFQHTYEVFLIENKPDALSAKFKSKDSLYEQENTYSTLLSRRFWFLNLLLLNFGYHNAHHAIMQCPWYNLRLLDKDLYPQESLHHITFFPLLKNYHRFRIDRIFHGQGQAIDQNQQTLEQFYGAIGVSFLVPVGRLSNWQEYKTLANASDS